MKKSDFYFDLPEELIAQTPLERRDAFGTVALEHGELEFDGRSPTVGGLEHTHGV